MHDEVLEIIDLDHINAPRIIAKGVKAFVGSPRSNAVYVVMLNGQLDRLDAASGKVLAVLGEIKQERVRLLIDPQETALWALCFNGGEGFTRAPTDETLIAFSPQAPGVLQQANVAVHQISDTCFLSGMLVTAIWSGALLCMWDAHQPMPLAVISGSAPFRSVDAAGDRLVAGDQKGNVWFLAPMDQLYP